MLQGAFCVVYCLILLACWWLARRHRDKPITQALLMPIASFALYALSRRVMLWRGGGDVLLADRYLLIFWLYELAWVVWAVVMTRRGRQGKAFLGPDGQRWRVYSGQANGRRVRHAVPVPHPQSGD